MKLASSLTFAGTDFDRCAHLRKDADQLAKQPNARFAFMWRGKPLIDITTHQLVLDSHAHPLVSSTKRPILFLGQDETIPYFAIDISHWTDPSEDTDQTGSFLDESMNHHPDTSDNHAFADLRNIMAKLSPRDAELCATMRGMFAWQDATPHCPSCGAKNTFVQAGWQAQCDACQASQFPRTDPVVIMLITHGNSTLMGRAPNWPDQMYSCLAGFMEPGETIEAAVRRETVEETGVIVGQVDYLASQPWAFPASLMIGCIGHAKSTEITIDPTEIEDAIWVTKEQLLDAYAGKEVGFKPAREGSIAGFLLKNWVMDTLD